jgi:hypothetical protein
VWAVDQIDRTAVRARIINAPALRWHGPCLCDRLDMRMPRTALIVTLGLIGTACGPGTLMPSEPDGGGGSGDKGGAAGALSGRAGSGATGVGGAAGAAGPGIALVTNADGWLEPNPAGAVGQWWGIGDYYGEDLTPGTGPCPAAGFPMSACSTLTTPTPGMPFRPDAYGEMCTSGIAAQVLTGSDGQLAWSAIWGNIVGFDLATPDPSPMPVIGTYDAPAHGITGFAFNIGGFLPLGRLRVLVTTAENHTNSAYWYGAENDLSPVNGPGHYEVRWPEVGGPLYLAGTAPPFDPTKIEAIAFHVVSRETDAAPYAFCISNVVLLTN